MTRAKPWMLGECHLATPRASVREFVEDEEYLGLGRAVFPEVLRALEDIFGGDYEEAVVSWGIGSGKSFLASVALSYMTHALLCLRDPQSSLGMVPGSRIVLLTMAPSERQAQHVVFGEFARLIEGSAWFAPWLGAGQRLAGSVRFPKAITVLSGNSSPTFPLGHNLLGVVVDEAAFFPRCEDGRREKVEDLYDSLRHRISSRFLHRGLILLVSSPGVVGDFVERKVTQASHDRRVYSTRKPVWEIRPGHLYCGRRVLVDGIRVPVEYEREFTVNRERAWRDLGARPMSALCPLLADGGVVDGAVRGGLRHPVDPSGRLCEWFRPGNRLPRYVHVDLGLTRDACGLAMVHCHDTSAKEAGPTAVVELAHRLTAPQNGEVDLARPREIILALAGRGFNIAQVSYDGWQSADSRQILARKGIRTATVSVDRTMEAYETLKELLIDGRLVLYPHEPLQTELKRLEVVAGRKVDHPAGGSKDLADAVAAAVHEAVRNWGGGEVRAQVL